MKMGNLPGAGAAPQRAAARMNAPPLTIRGARPDELETTSAIIRAAYAEYAEAMPGGRWERYMRHAADVWSRREEAELIVAELEGRLVGTVTFYPDASRSGAGGWPEGWAGIRLLAVHPEARGWGIGRALTEECIARARAQGAAAVGLHTTELMAVAKAMYERMGFARVPDLDYRPSSGSHALAYQFSLTPEPSPPPSVGEM